MPVPTLKASLLDVPLMITASALAGPPINLMIPLGTANVPRLVVVTQIVWLTFMLYVLAPVARTGVKVNVATAEVPGMTSVPFWICGVENTCWLKMPVLVAKSPSPAVGGSNGMCGTTSRDGKVRDACGSVAQGDGRPKIRTVNGELD